MTPYHEPIKVICINARNSTKLLKGATYVATCIYTSHTTERKITLKNIGTYSLANFTDIDGKSLDYHKDFGSYRAPLDSEKNYTGQFVRCRYSSGKSFKEGEIYYVENEKREKTKTYGGNFINNIMLKIRGVRNYVNPYRFEEIPIKEQRSIKLKNIKGEKVKTGEQTRKFLLYSEKEKTSILFQTLSLVLIDLNKIEFDQKIDLIKLMLTKGKNYCFTEEEIKEFLNTKIIDSIKQFNIL